MMKTGFFLGCMALAACVLVTANAGAMESAPVHDHPIPARLGTVHFENSCAPTVAKSFDRSLALLHSFAYTPAVTEFSAVGVQDATCAIAHWGVAMSLYHQLWDVPNETTLERGRAELLKAKSIGAKTERERAFIDAALVYYSDLDPSHHAARAQAYSQAMQKVAEQFPKDDEAQIFYALSLVATAPPTDRTHANQKRAIDILEPIYRRAPNHPGVAHYLIHACDSTELAIRGLPEARAYAKIAPSAPHALHMPSHIFTRLGYWEDSIASNQAARKAAREQGDVGEELHAMDYLTYAYLQRGRDADAERVVSDLKSMTLSAAGDFKVGYAATAMPVRLAVERGRWNDVLKLEPTPESAPHVAAIVHWARALAHAHTGQVSLAVEDIKQIDLCEAKAKESGDAYWAAQIATLSKEARAWREYFSQHKEDAASLMRQAADAEDALEKLPVTPGPIVPAREQLGVMLLELNRPQEAKTELEQALKDAPGRLAARKALQRATGEGGEADKIKAARLAQNDAIVRHDLDAIASYWTDDVTICRGLGAQESGKPAYLKLFANDDPHSKDVVIYVRTPDSIDASLNWPLAFETGKWQGHQGGVTGPVVIEGRYSAQWVKRKDQWLIRSEVFVALNGFGAGKDFKAIP